MNDYVGYRDVIYREKVWISANSKEEAMEKLKNDEYEDCTDLDYIGVCDNPNYQIYPE